MRQEATSGANWTGQCPVHHRSLPCPVCTSAAGPPAAPLMLPPVTTAAEFSWLRIALALERIADILQPPPVITFTEADDDA